MIMTDDLNKSTDIKQDSFDEYYNLIMTTLSSDVIVVNEWQEEGDTFQKLSFYDHTFIPIDSLNGTTMIKK